MKKIVDPEVKILAMCSGVLMGDYEDETEMKKWEESPFAWIRTRPSRTRGAIGEKLVAGYLATKGFDVTRSPDSEADRIVEGTRAEIKTSTLWKNGIYKFQQLRDQNYEFVICLGISPFDAHCWVLPKKVILDEWQNGNIVSQHGGKSGHDTAWLAVRPDQIPDWLGPWGGPMNKTASLISQVTGRAPA